MVTKTAEEWSGMDEAARKAHLADEEKTVFGRTVTNEPAYRKVKGVPQELGIGSKGRETPNHFRAILKYEGEAAHQEALAEIWKRDPDHATRIGLPKPRAKAP
jgi:hypothetical protein